MEKKIVGYKVVSDSDLGPLVAKVNELMKSEGWEPLGGIRIDEPQRDLHYLQTLVKKQPTRQLTAGRKRC